MQPTLLIREASHADIPTIRAIAENTWPVTYGDIISKEQIRYMLDLIYSDEALTDQVQKGHQFYIAVYDNRPIGFASVSLEESGGCKLNKLYVLPDIQKTGAGKALLQQVILYTQLQQQHRLFLQVNKHNNAKDFYQKMGFSIEREQKLDIGGGFFMDDYIMEISV